MGRAPCCDRMGLKKGPWTPEEDRILVNFIHKHGHGNWRALPKQAGLLRCGKSCRLRWTNYLRPDVKRGNFSTEERNTILRLHQQLGNRWSIIASHLPGRTDNEIKNFWNTHLKKRLPHDSECLKRISATQASLDVVSDFPSALHKDVNIKDPSQAEEKPNLCSNPPMLENISDPSFSSCGVCSTSSSDFSVESENSCGIILSSGVDLSVETKACLNVSSSSSCNSGVEALPNSSERKDDISLSSFSELEALDFFSIEADYIQDLQPQEELNPKFSVAEIGGGLDDPVRRETEGIDFWLQVLRDVDLSNTFPSF